MPPDINNRTFVFLCKVIVYVRTIDWEPGVYRIIDQLVGAAGGTASNRRESTGASSRKEFIRLNEIALREAKESEMWLMACQASKLGDQAQCDQVVVEAGEIRRVLGSIVLSAKGGP